MTSTFQPYREPLRTTVIRTVAIAVVVGAIFAWRVHSLAAWPVAFLLTLWISFGGHWVELWFLNWLRPRLSPTRATQIAARLATWFVAGVLLGFCIASTMRFFALTRDIHPRRWWTVGILFIGVELIAHLALALRRRPNFYNGEG